MSQSFNNIVISSASSLTNHTGAWSSRHAFVDQKKCIKCHQCTLVCPEGCVDILEDGKNVKVNDDYCKGCMVCAVECPVRAITMKSK